MVSSLFGTLRTGKREANQAPLDSKPAIHLSESAVALFPRVLFHPTMRSMQPVLSIASPSHAALSTIMCRRGSVERLFTTRI